MAQAEVNNNTAFAHEVIYSSDEAGRPIVTPVIKGTFDIQANGQVKFAKPQNAVNLEGKYLADPETSSYLYEPESAFIKTNTDIIVHGYALSGKAPVHELLVDIQVGSLGKTLFVTGNRYWIRQGKKFVISAPEKFERIPLLYENAFGGKDERHTDDQYHGLESRNTVGKGYYHIELPDQNKLPLPNIENPAQLIRHIEDRPDPAGCGFTLPHWEPRKSLAGTYDKSWLKSRSPLLPKNFDRKFFNAASENLISNGYLHGDESVKITNMTPDTHLSFSLPGIRPPLCQIETKDEEYALTTNLDTVVINTQSKQISLIWRNYFVLNNSHHELENMTIMYG